VYNMQNLTFGPEGALNPKCQVAFAEEPHLCFMSPHMQAFIKTPFFMLNSKYDSWQLSNELGTHDRAKVLQYGIDFLDQFGPVRAKVENGAAITSCVCHQCDWHALEVDGRSTMTLYADWYTGKTSGSDSIHVDNRGPNGDGAITLKFCNRVQDMSADLIQV